MSQNKRSCVLLLRPNAAKITNESILNEGCVCMLSCFGHVFTLCYPVDCSLPVSSPRTPKWAAMPSSRGSSWLRDQTHVSSTSRFSRPVSATWEAPKWRLSNVKWSENKVPLSLQSMLKVKPELFFMAIWYHSERLPSNKGVWFRCGESWRTLPPSSSRFLLVNATSAIL